MEQSSIIRVLRWKRGFFVASFVFYFLLFGGIALFLHRVLRLEGAVSLVDDVGLLLYVLYVPIFLVQLFECYLWGGVKTGEYILSLPAKRNTIFFVTAIGHFLVFSLALLLFYLILAIMLSGSGGALLPLLQKRMLVACIFTSELYLLTQLLSANCKNKLAALFLALGLNALKYVVFGGHPRMCHFHQFFIYPYLTVYGGQELLDYQEGSIDEISNFAMVNGCIMIALILLILISVRKQKAETAGWFYHRWFRFGVILVMCFYLVHLGWGQIGGLWGYHAGDFTVFTELLWIASSVGVFWCLQKYLARRGGVG